MAALATHFGTRVVRRSLAATAAPAVKAARAFSVRAEVKTSESGIQYVDEKEGTGPSPVKGARIKAHYTGRLTNGTKFDSSYDRGQPLAFAVGVGQVIKGWDEGILGGPGMPAMKEGGKRKLIIPPGLAYGARGAGGVIPPNATLEFDVELVAAK